MNSCAARFSRLAEPMRHLLKLAWVGLLIVGLVTILQAAPTVEVSRRVSGLFEPSRVDDLRAVVPTLPGVEWVSLDFASTVVVLRVDPAQLMGSYNAKHPPSDEQLARRLDEQLASASNRTFSLKPLASASAVPAVVVEVKTGLLDCRGCRYAVYNGVSRLDGLESATVTTDGRLIARIDPAKLDQKALLAALKKVKGLEIPAQ